MKQYLREVTSNGTMCKAIKQTQKDLWVFKGSLDDVGGVVVPHKLHNVTLWNRKGYTLSKRKHACTPCIDQHHSYLGKSRRLTYLIAMHCICPSQQMYLVSDQLSKLTLIKCLAYHSTVTSGEARNQRKSSQRLELAFRTKSQTMRNSNLPRECNRT